MNRYRMVVVALIVVGLLASVAIVSAGRTEEQKSADKRPGQWKVGAAQFTSTGAPEYGLYRVNTVTGDTYAFVAAWKHGGWVKIGESGREFTVSK